MKQCPVCNTSIFDDMDVCYGCMYQFDNKPCSVEFANAEQANSSSTSMHCAEHIEKTSETNTSSLLEHFLVEFERFLRDFLVNRAIQI